MVFYKQCKHRQLPVKIGSHLVYASSYQFDAWSDGKFPDLFVGLASLWSGKASKLLISGISERTPTPLVPTIQVSWDDSRAISYRDMNWLVTTILKHIHNNEMVEISCIGGHGRTGTLLACLLGTEEGLTPKKAIGAVHERYCGEAVESIAQIEQVYVHLGSSKEQANKEWEIKAPKFDWKAWWKREQKEQDGLVATDAGVNYFGGY